MIFGTSADGDPVGKIIHINPAYISKKEFSEVVRVLKRGDVVIYPTDTIYGIGCDVRKKAAVEKVFSIKSRAENNPALILAGSFTMVQEIFDEISPRTFRLMREFWPGPFTIVARSKRIFHTFLQSDDGMVGIRIPASRFCLRLIREIGAPIVSTSVNRSGTPPLLHIDEITKEFQSSVDLIVDAGELKPSQASTVIRIDGDQVTLLREGAIPWKRCERYFKKTS
jgi:tRNA threonylcarbamoyl adenosine modification protein (Sua5/YciO/YrdC/YwlC family)